MIAAAPGRFSVVSVAGGRDGAALAKCAIELGAEFAALADPAGYSDLKAGLAGFEIEIAAGPEAVKEAALRDADLVVSAIVGAAGLAPTFAAVAAGRTVALANKETLVCAGEAVMEAARRAGVDAVADGFRAQRDVPGDRRARSGHDRENDHHRVRRPVPRMERRAHRRRHARGSARPSQLGDGAEK